MRMLDPNAQFVIRGDIVAKASDIAQMRRIPDCDNAPIYAEFMDSDYRIVIGIAQSDGSSHDAVEWAEDQMRYPVLRSIDRMDLFGNVIRDLTEEHN
jgi:hypothetical protein